MLIEDCFNSNKNIKKNQNEDNRQDTECLMIIYAM